MFEGVFPAIITPFKKDLSLDEEGLRRNIEYLGETGIAGIVPCGTTGESATLSLGEHKMVVKVAVLVAVDSRVVLIVLLVLWVDV